MKKSTTMVILAVVMFSLVSYVYAQEFLDSNVYSDSTEDLKDEKSSGIMDQ